MKIVKMHEAKTNLSALVREVSSGVEPEVVVCIGGRAAARIVPLGSPPRRSLGSDRGLITIAPDFDAVNPEIAALFEVAP
ncbi:MAG: type II toxin-antitoxin system Phd/YefM family antitoxin [bacterium]|nr:type II toxin-antitoxin system Phd/YefM family antitoxin [bacterium]